MKKYCYCMTGNQVWFDAAVELYDRNIAEPVFWLGLMIDITRKPKKNLLQKCHEDARFCSLSD